MAKRKRALIRIYKDANGLGIKLGRGFIIE